MPGYSGTPLARKLGFGEGTTMVALGAPAEYAEWLAPLPKGARIVARAPESPRAVHLFRTRRAELSGALAHSRRVELEAHRVERARMAAIELEVRPPRVVREHAVAHRSRSSSRTAACRCPGMAAILVPWRPASLSR